MVSDHLLGIIPFEPRRGRLGYDFRDDGQTLVTQDRDNLLFWDISGETLSKSAYFVFRTTGDVINFRSVNDKIVLVKDDHSVEVWDMDTGQLQTRFLALIKGNSIEISPDGNLVAGWLSSGDNHNRYVYRIATGELLIIMTDWSVLSPDWSKYVTSDGEQLTVTDINTGVTTILVH